jgi:2,4-dienoyl-CoA reductase-like NADH-dependent reductase (Old Yellow Enzyme family)
MVTFSTSYYHPDKQTDRRIRWSYIQPHSHSPAGDPGGSLGVGPDFPIQVRLGASDYTEGGTTIEDSKIAAGIRKADVDIIHISGGFVGYTPPGLIGQGYFAPLSEAIKSVVSIAVILTGGITEVEDAEKFLQEKEADLIGVGRAILHDSTWAKRAIEHLDQNRI